MDEKFSEFSEIQGNWEIREAWIWVNSKILSVTFVFMALWYHISLLYRRLLARDALLIHFFLQMLKILQNSFRENSIAHYKWWRH